MYKIINQNDSDAKSIKNFIDLLHEKTKTEIVYLDIVSIEKKRNKKYNVSWFGPDNSFLTTYYTLITEYFSNPDNENNTSLLFLENGNDNKGINSRHLFFNNNQNNCNCKIDCDNYLSADFVLDDPNDRISKSIEQKYITNWQEKILSHLCVANATFSKIEFKIKDREFVAAIWVGYNKENSTFNQYDVLLYPYLENFLWSYSSNSIANELITDVELQATKAAISQVMARNMSHNIGSHVLSKIVTKEAVQNVLSDNELTENNQYIPFPELNINIKPTEKVAWFNSYLRNRMDYLADIATGEPAMEVTRQLVSEVISGIDKNRILLNQISGVDDLIFSIIVKDCRECTEECDKTECECDGKNKDIPISIPNDSMGYHALYVIIENLIRNTAKHQNKQDANNKQDDEKSQKPERKFTIEVRKCDYDNSLYEVLIFDNIQIKGNVLNNKLEKTSNDDIIFSKDDKQFFKMHSGQGYTDQIKTRIDWLVFQQNCRLNLPVINPETNRLRDGAWGLIEMDVSAAYLRKIAPERIDNSTYDIYFDENWKARKKNERDGKTYPNILTSVNKNNSLAYRFHLMKPKEMVVVDETGELYNELKTEKWKLEKLRENGISVLQSTDSSAEDFFKIASIYSHPFLLIIAREDFNINHYLFTKVKIQHNDIETESELFRGNLPTRIIVCKEKNGDINGLTKNSEESPWYIVIEKCDPVYERIKKADDASFKRNCPITDKTIMDDIWQIWLKHKAEFYGIKKLRSEELIEKRIKQHILLDIDKCDKSSFDCFTVFLEHHAINISDRFTENGEKKCKFGHYHYYPSAVKQFIDNATKDRISDKDNATFDKISLAKLTDSILTNILVVDERVQKAWKEEAESGTGIYKYKAFEAAGIYSPDFDSVNTFDLNIANFEPAYWQKLNQLIINISEKSKIKGLDYIVIHLGVIEKMLTAQGEPKKQKNVLRFVYDLQNILDKKTRVVITSGRGKPDNLPEEIPFINFSTLSQYTIEIPFKPYLNQVVQNARKFKS